MEPKSEDQQKDELRAVARQARELYIARQIELGALDKEAAGIAAKVQREVDIQNISVARGKIFEKLRTAA